MQDLESEKARLARQKQQIAQREAKLKSKLRRQRTRRLIELGGLVAKAELDHLPSNVLYGALLSCKGDLQNQPAVKEQWQATGAAAFEKESGEATPLILKLATKEDQTIRAHLRQHGLKYNRLRQEWYGNVKEVEELLRPLKEQDITYNLEEML